MDEDFVEIVLRVGQEGSPTLIDVLALIPTLCNGDFV